jgi:hypothetical protein
MLFIKKTLNKLSIKILKSLKGYHARAFGIKPAPKPQSEQDPDRASHYIYETLTADKPCMIARFGAVELACLCNYLAIKGQATNYAGYIKGVSQPWWWEPGIMNEMHNNTGFFPANEDQIEHFCELVLRDISEVDILGSWLPEEAVFNDELKTAKKIRLCFLDPFWAASPWTKALEGKNVLVVHPFTSTMEQQYKKRELLLFGNKQILPEFNLKTIKAVQSVAGTKTRFADWFEALDFMKSEIDRVDYDICLIGCGAYGFPLAAHVKRTGKKAFHLGGSLQLLFGIIGNRWADKNYSKFLDYSQLINKHWVRPSQEETPVGAIKVEGACYW